MWFLNTWADGLKKFFLSQGKKPRDEERRTPAGDNKKEALGFSQCCLDWWQILDGDVAGDNLQVAPNAQAGRSQGEKKK